MQYAKNQALFLVTYVLSTSPLSISYLNAMDQLTVDAGKVDAAASSYVAAAAGKSNQAAAIIEAKTNELFDLLAQKKKLFDDLREAKARLELTVEEQKERIKQLDGKISQLEAEITRLNESRAKLLAETAPHHTFVQEYEKVFNAFAESLASLKGTNPNLYESYKKVFPQLDQRNPASYAQAKNPEVLLNMLMLSLRINVDLTAELTKGAERHTQTLLYIREQVERACGAPKQPNKVA